MTASSYAPAWTCALCGRATKFPGVFVGGEAIGPACSRKAGLLGLGAAKKGRVVLPYLPPRKSAPRADFAIRDLFEDVPL